MIRTIRFVFLVYLLFFGFSVSIDPIDSHVFFRLIRALVSLLFIPILLLKFLPKNNHIVGFCVFYSISSFLSIGFESYLFGALTMIANGISFLFLSKMIIGKIERKPMSWVFLIALVIVVLINIWLLYLFLEAIFYHVQNIYLLLAICLSTVSSFTLAVLAFIYNYESNSKSSLLFVFFIIFLVFAETFRAAGHYSFIDPVLGQYAGRLLLIVSFGLLLRYATVQLKMDRL